MKLIPVTVNLSEINVDEPPESFIYDGIKLAIVKVTDRWYQGDSNPEFPASDYFKADTLTGTFILKHEIQDDKWYLCI